MTTTRMTESCRRTSHYTVKEERCCRCLCWHPRCLRRLASLNLFIFVVCLLMCFSAAALAVFEGLVTTIETRYQLSASEIGLSASMFTVGTISSTVIVTYFGGRPSSSRPVWIGIGGLFLSVGAALHAMPQFILSPYRPPSSPFHATQPGSNGTTGANSGLCSAIGGGLDTGDGDALCGEDERQILVENTVAYVIIVIGQILLGVGYGPLVPLSLTYIDDNATRGTTGLASGILESMFGLGAIIGFQLASVVSGLWVDFYRVDAPSTNALTPRDHGWVGAWWLGLLIMAGIFLVVAVPLFGFPSRIPRRGDTGEQPDEEEAIKAATTFNQHTSPEAEPPREEKTSLLKDLIEWPRSVRRLVKRPVFLLASLSSVTEGALVYSLAAFFPKYMQVQFGLDVPSANLIAGFAFVPPWALGALLGGFVVKKFSFMEQSSAAMGVVSAGLACCLAVSLIFIGCDNPPIAGVTVAYQGDIDYGIYSTDQLESLCNYDCLCPIEPAYDPHCGSDGVTYFSPCYAGCKQAGTDNGEENTNRTFTDCSCLNGSSEASSSDLIPPTVTRGHCPYTCSSKAMFVVVMILWAVSLSSATSPRIIIIVSSVDPADKSLALGFSRVLMLLAGSLPFPFLYGACIDSTCLVWQTLCNERGLCSVYDIERFRHITYSLTTFLIALQCLFFTGIWFISRKRGTGGAKTPAISNTVTASSMSNTASSGGFQNEAMANESQL